MSTELLIYGVLFIGVFLVVVAGHYLIASALSGSQRNVNRRLQQLESGAAESEVLALRRARRRYERVNGLFAGLARKAEVAGLELNRWTIGGIWLILTLLLIVAIRALSPLSFPAAALFAALAANLLLWAWLSYRANRRRRVFEEQLPDALDLMVRSLRIGQPLNMAIGSVARDMPAPVGPEFTKISQELTYGISMAEAFDRLAERQDSQDLRFLTVAISIQSQSGGSLAELMESLANVVRSRFLMFRKIRALTAEGRFSGWFLSAFPVFMVFAVQWVRPDYFVEAQELPQFNIWAFIFVAMLLLNIVFMRVISNIKV